MVTLQDQLDWETKHREEGLRQLRKQVSEAREQNRATDTPLGSVALRKYVLEFSSKIAKDITDNLNSPGVAKQAVPLLFALDVDSVALITLRTVLNSVFNTNKTPTLVKVASEVGKSLYGELALAVFRDTAPDLYEALVNDFNSRLSKDLRYRLTVFKQQAKANGIDLPEWTTRQKVLVGTYLINILVSESFGLELFSVCHTHFAGKSSNILTANPKLQHIFDDLYNMLEDSVAKAAPCLIKPQDWTGKPNEGGFHGCLKIKAIHFYKGPSSYLEIMKYYNANLDPTFKMLNVHQQVAWKVNPYIHDLVINMDKKGLSINKVVEFQSGITGLKPVKPAFLNTGEELTPEQEAEFKEWKAKMRYWYMENKRVGRAESRVYSVLKAAGQMINCEKFYYVYQVDYRGRMYPVSGPLNPQGSDLQKAMIHAAHGAPIDSDKALWWFKLSLAAKYGIDKLSPDECVQWVDDNRRNIMAAAKDPLDRDAFAWWSDADKPMQFIAVCDEYRRYNLDKTTFLNRIAVSMDGSCNGLQNYSALLRDPIGGLATNLLASKDDKPNDIYKEVAEAAYRRLVRMPFSVFREGWKEHIVDRKITKKPVMTQVYGSTFGTCRDAVLEYCFDKGLFDDQEYEFAEYAADLIWKAIGDVVVKATEAMGWIRDATTAILKQKTNGVHQIIAFPSPTGFVVVQDYIKCSTIKITTCVGKSIQLRVGNTDDFKPNRIRHRNSSPPNFIHCVDGGHMTFTTSDMDDLNIENLFLHFVHDDYGTLAKYADTLSHVLRDAFVRMHSSYSIEMFGKFYNNLPKPPERGTLDINCVRDSINFFR